MKELYKITDKEFSVNYMADSLDKAIMKYSKHRFWEKPEATKVLTDQGYPVTTIDQVPVGKYFHFVVRNHNEFYEMSMLLRKDTYDPELNGYRCYKVHFGHEEIVVKRGTFVSIDAEF